jgi:large subunit ribosomal protein L25
VSDQDVTLTLENREVVGKQVKRLRREGQVPAVIHDHGKESVHVQAAYLPMYKVYARAGKHHPVNLSVGSKKFTALIKDAHFEPRKNRLQHVVFNAIRQNEKVETEVPVVLEGEIPAEKKSLIVLPHTEVVNVEGLPKDLVDKLSVDATSLAEDGDKLTVADIKMPAGLTMLTDPETVLATVETPKDQIAEANEAAAEQAAADGKTEEPTTEDEGTEPAADSEKSAETNPQ